MKKACSALFSPSCRGVLSSLNRHRRKSILCHELCVGDAGIGELPRQSFHAVQGVNLAVSIVQPEGGLINILGKVLWRGYCQVKQFGGILAARRHR